MLLQLWRLMVIGHRIAQLETGKIKCYRSGDKGHIERNCQNSPMRLRRERSHSRSPVSSRSPRGGRSRSFSKSHSYRFCCQLVKVPARRGRDVEYDERRFRSPARGSPDPKRSASPSKSRKGSSTHVREDPRQRGRIEMEQYGYSDSPKETNSLPRRGRMKLEQNGCNDIPKENSRSTVNPTATRYGTANDHIRNPSPTCLKDDSRPVDNDNEHGETH